MSVVEESSQRKLRLSSYHTQKTEMFYKRLGSRYPQDEELSKALMASVSEVGSCTEGLVRSQRGQDKKGRYLLQ